MRRGNGVPDPSGISPSGIPLIYPNFLSLPPEQSDLATARLMLIPVPYDSTTSFHVGARYGPQSIVSASYGLEDYDPELGLDVSEIGIHTTAALEPHMGGPGPMVARVREAVAAGLEAGKTVGVLGGEHSITAGSVQAYADAYPSLSVLYLDAHADMRDEYMGTPWGHASAARRVFEVCPIVLAGVRSLSQEEHAFLRGNGIPVSLLLEDGPSDQTTALPADDILAGLSEFVYISVDLDVLDPGIMAAVGTPEPGGVTWRQLTSLLRRVGESRRIVGFDVCELAPNQGPPACSYTAAKLVYKLAQYACCLPRPACQAGTVTG